MEVLALVELEVEVIVVEVLASSGTFSSVSARTGSHSVIGPKA